jgi:competence protein ComEC
MVVRFSSELLFRLPPALWIATGAAAAFYTFPLLHSGAYASASWGRIIFGCALLLFMLTGFLQALSHPSVSAASTAPRKLSRLVIALSAGLALGVAAAASLPGPCRLGLENNAVIALSGTLKDDPRVFSGGRGMGTLDLKTSAAAGGVRASAAGTLPVFFPEEVIPKLKEFGRGCEIFIDGKLVDGNRGLFFTATSVHVLKSASRLELFRTGIRRTLLAKFGVSNSNTAPAKGAAWGGLASALLLGVRDDLDVDLAADFRDAGCSHVLALSGFHLALISGILAFFLRRPLGLKGASIAGALFIIFYVFIAGAQPSLLRSAIMYLLGCFAVFAKLKKKPLILWALAFILQLVVQPESALSISFILSYLALGGILIVNPIVYEMCRGRLPEFLSGGLSVSIGAFITTAAVTGHFFGVLRPVGIVAGLLVMPLCSLFMMLALAALCAGFVLPFLFDLLSRALELNYLALKYTNSFFAGAPGLVTPNVWPVLATSILSIVLLLFLSGRLTEKRRSIAAFD